MGIELLHDEWKWGELLEIVAVDPSGQSEKTRGSEKNYIKK